MRTRTTIIIIIAAALVVSAVGSVFAMGLVAKTEDVTTTVSDTVQEADESAEKPAEEPVEIVDYEIPQDILDAVKAAVEDVSGMGEFDPWDIKAVNYRFGSVYRHLSDERKALIALDRDYFDAEKTKAVYPEKKVAIEELEMKYGRLAMEHKREYMMVIGELPEDQPRLTLALARSICDQVKDMGITDPNNLFAALSAIFNDIAGAPDFYGGSGITKEIYNSSDSSDELILLNPEIGDVIYSDGAGHCECLLELE